ncbi:MAG: YbaB/EbfC family nucleoid-associated protein [Chloroflexi bacterium HGW-Chloroflexi-10]|nr:MAG: YbaB/EbfC family nucleoid-associated protein [Chloroflexi bacterium HGW-Chloroflexi-10]
MSKGRGGKMGGFGGGGGGGGNQANMMRQLQRLQEEMEKAQAALADETVSVTVGGGAIKVVMTGDQHCKSVEIDADMLKEADAEMLQDLVLSAVNMALDQSRELQSTRLGPLTGGLPGF